MKIPKSVKELPRETLEEMFVEDLNVQHYTIHRANDMEECIKEIERLIKKASLYGEDTVNTSDIEYIIERYRKWFDEH